MDVSHEPCGAVDTSSNAMPPSVVLTRFSHSGVTHECCRSNARTECSSRFDGAFFGGVAASNGPWRIEGYALWASSAAIGLSTNSVASRDLAVRFTAHGPTIGFGLYF